MKNENEVAEEYCSLFSALLQNFAYWDESCFANFPLEVAKVLKIYANKELKPDWQWHEFVGGEHEAEWNAILEALVFNYVIPESRRKEIIRDNAQRCPISPSEEEAILNSQNRREGNKANEIFEEMERLKYDLIHFTRVQPNCVQDATDYLYSLERAAIEHRKLMEMCRRNSSLEELSGQLQTVRKIFCECGKYERVEER